MNKNFNFNKNLFLLDLEENQSKYLKHLERVASVSYLFPEDFFQKITPVYDLIGLEYSDDFNSMVGKNTVVFIKDFFIEKAFSKNAKKFASSITKKQAVLIKKLIILTTDLSQMSIEKFLTFNANFGFGNKLEMEEKINLLENGFNHDEIVSSILNDEKFDMYIETNKISSFKSLSGAFCVEIISRIYNLLKPNEQKFKKILFALLQEEKMTGLYAYQYEAMVKKFPCVELFNLWLANTMVLDKFSDGKSSFFLIACQAYKLFSEDDLFNFCNRLIEANNTISKTNKNPPFMINDLGPYTVQKKSIVNSKRVPIELVKKVFIELTIKRVQKKNGIVLNEDMVDGNFKI